MPLPILQDYAAPTPENLVRLFHRTELHWVRHLGEETQLDGGVAITSRELPRVAEANRVMDAALPPGASPDEALDEVRRHFAIVGTDCLSWVVNPAAPESGTGPLVERLVATGWESDTYDIMRLGLRPSTGMEEVAGLTVISARASFRHARALADEAAAEWDEPQLADASMLHLDDPHWDVLIALRDGQAIASAGVLAVGEIGRIDQVFVAKAHRRGGVGRMLVGRVLDVCARSLFKHVMLRVRPDDGASIGLYASMGFRRIGQLVAYHRPIAR